MTDQIDSADYQLHDISLSDYIDNSHNIPNSFIVDGKTYIDKDQDGIISEADTGLLIGYIEPANEYDGRPFPTGHALIGLANVIHCPEKSHLTPEEQEKILRVKIVRVFKVALGK